MGGEGGLLAAAAEKGEIVKTLAKIAEQVGWAELLEIGGIILVAVIGGWAFKRLILSRFEKMAAATDNDVDDRLVYFLGRFYKGLIAFVVLLVILKILRVELTPLLAGAGIVGIGIAYAAKDILGNFLSGIFLLIDRPIKIGDRILIERIGTDWGSWGDVVDVGLRTTTVKNTDGVYVTYPNAKLAESVIRNFSPTNEPLRFRIRVLVTYDTDLEAALVLLLQLAGEEEQILKEPEPSAVVRSLFNPSSQLIYDGAVLELRSFVSDIRIRTKLRSKMLIRIKQAFEARGITLAHAPRAGAAAAPEPVDLDD